MIRKTIVRTMDISTIYAHKLIVIDGKPEVVDIEPLSVCGKITPHQALKELRKIYGKHQSEGISIAEIKTERASFEISVDDFMKHAKRIEVATSEKN